VHVAVEHEHALGEPVAAERRERDGDVVEEAVAAREVAAGVVRAAAQVHRHTALARAARRGQRAADRAAPALDQLGRPRQPQPALLAQGQAALADPRQQPAIVDRGEFRPLDRRGLAQLVRRCQPVGDEPLGQQPVLLDREPVVRRKREAPAMVGPDFH
jgi:hypothetical protein